MTASSLEARYRRLLTWFPAEHRRVHGDEMAGVLLATAEPGRHRPSRAESLNLMLSGLRVRIRPGSALTDGEGWRDALAIFSVVMPILMLVGAGVVEWVQVAQFGWGSSPLIDAVNLILYGQLLTVPLVLLGLRRWAVVATLLPVALGAWFVGHDFYHGYLNAGLFFVLGQIFGAYVLIGGVLELVALLASPGPRRGRQLLRGRRWAYVAAAVVPAAVVAAPADLLQYLPGTNSRTASLFGIVAVSAIIGLGAAWLTSGLGKRLAVLFAVLACAYLATAVQELTQVSVFPGVLTLLSEIGTALIAVAMMWRVRQRPARQRARS